MADIEIKRVYEVLPDNNVMFGYAWYRENSSDSTSSRKKKPDPYGLYDMHGNVRDWVLDGWHSDYDGADRGSYGSSFGFRILVET